MISDQCELANCELCDSSNCRCRCHAELTLEELKILDTWLNYQALPYDNYELQRIVKKIGQLVAQK